MKRLNIFLVITLLGVNGLAACAPTAASTNALTPIALQLRWTHQAQFAGFYAADQNGYYAEEGLTVNFLEGGPAVDIHQSVLDGAAQFGVAGADTLILKRASGNTLRTIAMIYRHSALVFIALESSGISKPQDFIGQTINIAAFNQPILHAMTARVDIAPNQYTVVQLPDAVAALVSGQVQVTNAFITNEPQTLEREGYKFNVIYPDDYGVHFYGDSLYASDDFITHNPDLVLRFLRATLKGWTYAVENPTAIGPMVLKYSPKADVEHETAFMSASIPLVNTGEDFIGWMEPEIWAGMETTLREQGVLTAPLDVTQVYTLQFIEEIYGK